MENISVRSQVINSIIDSAATNLSKRVKSNDIEDFMNDNTGYCSLIASLYVITGGEDAGIMSALKDYIVNLHDEMADDELNLLVENKQEAFEISLKKIRRHYGVSHICGSSIEGEEAIVNLARKLLRLDSNARVYLPYAWEGQFKLLNMDLGCSGFTEDDKSRALSKIVTGMDLEILENGLHVEEGYYDLAFAQPALSSGVNAEIFETLKQCLEYSLKPTGSLACVFPEYWSYSSDDSIAGFRKYIVDNGYNIANILIPNPFYGDKLSLVIIGKQKDGVAVMADTSSEDFCAITDITYHLFTLKVDSIVETIATRDRNHFWGGSVKELASDYNLFPSRYLFKNIGFDGKACELGDLTDLVEGEQVSSSLNRFYHVGINDLYARHVNCEVNKKECEPMPDVSDVKAITSPCLCFAYVNGKAMVGKIEDVGRGSAVLVDKSIVTFTARQDKVLEDYLLYSLLTDDTARQIGLLSYPDRSNDVDMFLPNVFRHRDFGAVRIYCPEIAGQQKICERKLKAYLGEAEKSKADNFEEFRKDMHMKKHAVGQTLFNLDNWFQLLMVARKSGDGVLKDDAVIGNVRKTKVEDIYKNIGLSIVRLQEQISRFDIGYGMVAGDMALTLFIEDYISSNNSPMFKFIYDEKRHHAKKTIPGLCPDGNLLEAGEPLEFVKFPAAALSIIMDNIVSNACAHGFASREQSENFIKIDLHSEGTSYVLCITNNGARFNDGLSEDEVFTYGKSSKSGKQHSGIGGYEIRKLMREFGGEAELLNNPEEEFSFGYRLIFNNTDIITTL